MKNSKKPLISVVMPVYNRVNAIRHAIQSILDQTLDNWELIIVDDGSTDDTKRTIKLFRDKRIKYVKNNKNMGISYSRNRGNAMAKGEIIVVQDSDDMSLPDRLEEINYIFGSYKHLDILYHWFYIRAMDIHYGARAIHREINRCGVYDKKKALIQPYIPGQLAYRKRVLKKIKYREEVKYWDDWAFIIDATMHNLNFMELKKPLYEYVISEDSVTTKSDHDGTREIDKETLSNILRKEYKLQVQ